MELIELTKVCARCGAMKSWRKFHARKDGRFGIMGLCKRCNSERVSQWKKDNPEQVRSNRRNYVSRHRAEHNARGRKWHAENKERSRNNSRQYKSEHKEHYRELYKKWIKKKRATDIKYALRHRIEVALRNSLKENKAGRSWEKICGYTLDKLKKHIEKLFTDGMTWEKFLKGEIHIDHKTPVSVFNFTKPEHQDFRKCWALKNLQPMWALENCAKGAKLTKHFQPSLLLE